MWKTYHIILIKFEAASPVDPPEVGSGKFDNIQFERLLHKHNVVLSHAKAVEVAWKKWGAKRDWTDLLHFPQRWLFVIFIWNSQHSVVSFTLIACYAVHLSSFLDFKKGEPII